MKNESGKRKPLFSILLSVLPLDEVEWLCLSEQSKNVTCGWAACFSFNLFLSSVGVIGIMIWNSIHPRNEEGIKVPYLTKATDVVTIKAIWFSYYTASYVNIYTLWKPLHMLKHIPMFIAKRESRNNWWISLISPQRSPTACLYSVVLTIPLKMVCPAVIFCHKNKLILSIYKNSSIWTAHAECGGFFFGKQDAPVRILLVQFFKLN